MGYTSIRAIVIALTLALGAYAENYGTLHISGIPSHLINLVIANDKLFASNVMSVFSSDSPDMLVSMSNKKYLQVNSNGQLVVEERYEPGILITKEKDKNGLQLLTYNDDEIFQICEDDSIAYKSNCSGARNVTIGFDYIFQ